jgi:hypothetical protein
MEPLKNMLQTEENQNKIITFPDQIVEKLNEASMRKLELPKPTEKETKNKKLLDQENQQEQERKEKNHKRKTNLIFTSAAAILLILLTIATIYTNNNALTGYITATKETQQLIRYNQAYQQNTETQLELANITSLRISGTLQGTSAKIKLRINNTDYLIADITNQQEQNQATGLATGEEPTYSISTDKTNYVLGETITITITPGAENKSLYVNYGEETHKLEGNTYTPEVIGEYTAIALIVLPNDILRLETNFTITEQPNETTQNTTTNQTTQPETPAEPTPEPALTTGYEFTNLCTETCSLAETSNPVLIIELEPNTTLTITELIITQNKENSAPEQTHNIPDISLATGQTTTLDLNQYFTDTDEDTIQYDINEIPEINAQITQNTLTITSQQTGTYTAFIYATDGDKLTTSNTFQITIQEQTNQTTTNETIPITNETTNQTTEPTNSLPEITDCSTPDPNKRPLECLNSAEYFQEQTLFITNNAREPIARITSIGNLILSGEVIENESFQPDSGDYTIGYEDSFGSRYTTVWFESKTGNLHLAGALHEEMINEVPTPGFFALRNKKGIVLIWADSITGDLFVRGNVIPYRKNILK